MTALQHSHSAVYDRDIQSAIDDIYQSQPKKFTWQSSATHPSVGTEEDFYLMTLQTRGAYKLYPIYKKAECYFLVDDNMEGQECAPEPEIESPFDDIIDRLPDEEKLIYLISWVRKMLRAPYGEQLANRLHFLFAAAQEETPEDTPISPESLKNFIKLLQSNAKLKYPDVVLTPSNNIRVQWRVDAKRHFAVEFFPNGDTHFVIFAPDTNNPDAVIRLSGISSVESLMEVSKPHGVSNWAVE